MDHFAASLSRTMLIIFGVDIYSARVVALGLVYTLQCVDGRAVFTQIRTIRLVSLLLCEPVKCTTYLLTFFKKIAHFQTFLCAIVHVIFYSRSFPPVVRLLLRKSDRRPSLTLSFISFDHAHHNYARRALLCLAHSPWSQTYP